MRNNTKNFILILWPLICLSVNCSKSERNNVSRFQEPHPPYPYIVEEVKFTNSKDGAQLAGTFTIPNTKSMFPAVVLISGSGLQDRDETTYNHKPFKVLADYLTRQNIAVLRYDDRGAGQSTGPMNNLTPDNFAEDAYSALQYLKSKNNIDTNKIGLIGHSMGAVEGSILASRYDDISFLVMLGGPGIPLDKHMLLSDSVSNSRSGKSLDEINVGQNLLKSMISEVKKGNACSITEINLNRIIAEWRDSLPPHMNEPIKEFTKNNPNYWEQMASEWATPYFRYVLNYDPYAVLTKVSCPTLSLIGEKDVQTLPEENSLGIRKAFENGKCPNYRVDVVKGVNHLFQKCETGTIYEYAHIEETFNESVMEEIALWIIKRSQQAAITFQRVI